MSEPRADLRRYPRARVAWKVIVDMPDLPGGRPRMRRTVDFSPYGMKVRLDERLPEGIDAHLRLSVPDRRPLEIRAIVWRSDANGPVFVFVGVSPDELVRMKSLVDSYRST
ncbi:MAG TPA: PilZ domain-containing protein [Candidatus Methylomirabilis sp.]|nr:PilZ domain-containing protein [Candidatus Methylomirabilis sp.]